MLTLRILTEIELRDLVPLDAVALRCIEDALMALALVPVAMPPILRLDIPEHHGEVDVKTAYVSGFDGFAIKISPGFFNNPKLGLPSVNGLMVLLSTKTGLVDALLLDNGYLTDVRTAAAGAVSAKHLSRLDSSVVAIFGAGVQARLQLKALTLVRPIHEARIWARNPKNAEVAAADLSAELGIAVSAVAEGRIAAQDADILVTTTPAETPILMADWVAPGVHITAVGSDAEHKNELDPALINKADLYVPDRLSQTRRLGELHHAIKSGHVPEGRDFVELASILAGHAPGRVSAQAITIADLTGTGVQDTAIATLAFARAKVAGVGMLFRN